MASFSMKPKILLSLSSEMKSSYAEAVNASGGRAYQFYLPQENASHYDALMLCGGGDVDPDLYEAKNTASSEIDLKRDIAETSLVAAFIAAGKPVLGICRGHQILNVCLGGTLIQHIKTADLHVAKNGIDSIYVTKAAEGSFVQRLYGSKPVTNSSHHQAVDKLASNLVAVQWAEDGVIEACQHKTKPIYSVQWHPERMCLQYKQNGVEDGEKLFRWFINEVIR
jgi:putative glutamine amidotransferase